jgi:hypothetical protein
MKRDALQLVRSFYRANKFTARANKRLQRLLKTARFKVDAQIEGIDYAYLRGLKKSQLANLITGE